MSNKVMTLYYNSDCENARNTYYPYEMQINSEDDLRIAVSHDHVCAKYKGNYRKKKILFSRIVLC